MADNSVSLRGYGYDIHKRDGFRCRYCGVNGSASFVSWLTLTVDHLLPNGHPDRENDDFKVTACQFCNVADNHYFENAKREGFSFDDLTSEELLKRRLPFVQATRAEYFEFWKTRVKNGGTSTEVEYEDD